ncbi:MAG TPA: hypothetical protein VF196_01040 [Casimicrobiaceae bacterium]
MHRRTALIGLATAGFILLALVPALVTFGLGWLRLPHIQPWGAPPAKDTTTLEQWTLFAVVYLFWMIGLTVLMILVFDHLGHHWRYYESSPRRKKKSVRRARATMQQMNAEQQATMQALRRREARDAQRRAARERDEARRRGPDDGAGGR